eukprot:SAG25_NODE_536_length_7104_cov_4.295789_2_plen_118_part_00
MKTLGATYVTDYEKEDIFDSLPDDSIDFVCACSRNDTVSPPSSKSDASDGGVGGGVGGGADDNYGAEGSADKAMRVLRQGGTYLLMPHGECYVSKKQAPPCLSAKPKHGVTQVILGG